MSPEGDHFPQTPLERTYVRPSPKAPTPPRRNALRCIRGGMRGVWHGVLGAGKMIPRLVYIFDPYDAVLGFFNQGINLSMLNVKRVSIG